MDVKGKENLEPHKPNPSEHSTTRRTSFDAVAPSGKSAHHHHPHRSYGSVSKDTRLRSSTSVSDSQNVDYLTDDYDDLELEEPFSTSEDEEPDETTAKQRRTALSLPLPRRRIRTLSGTVMPIGFSPVFGGPTMCLDCLEFFDLPRETSKYTTHLMEKHKIIVTDIELIVDLKRYIEYWRKRFTNGTTIQEVFPTIVPVEGDALFGKTDKYYLMSEQIKEDRQLRERLALRRLEEILSCQQRERADKSFNKQCLFCRYRVKGNRAKLIHHLFIIHHLNLVFVNEYLDLLKKKLDSFQCFYCEKIFPDHAVLSEHMRKKSHREVNPKNSYYDKFYVINYLELGKRWLEVLAEDFEDTMPAFHDSEDDDEEETWNEWQEDNTEDNEMTIICLFCDDAFDDSANLLEHMKESHRFDYRSIVKKENWDIYQQIKFVNFVRKQTYNRICFVCGRNDLGSWQALRKHVSDGEHLNSLPPPQKWDLEEYLLPTYENDYFLCSVADESTCCETEGDLNAQKDENSGQTGKTATSKYAATRGYLIIPEDFADSFSNTFLREPELLEELR